MVLVTAFIEESIRDRLDGQFFDEVILGTKNADTLEGSLGDDWITGLGEDDLMTGQEGNDALDGGDGADSLSGGEGDDTLLGGDGDDLLQDDLGDDLLDGENGNDSIIGGEGNDTLYGGEDDDSLDGGEGNDSLHGGNGSDTLQGGIGNDEIGGGGNADLIDADDGDDSVSGGDGNDTIYGSSGNDELLGESGDDVLYGDDGDDSIDGGLDNDSISGGSGKDTLSGGDGSDQLSGGEDDDYVSGEEGADEIFGDDGNDSLDGGQGSDQIDGGLGQDLIQGEDGDDYIDGGEGSDTIWGGEGNDTVLGGTGNDLIYPGSGRNLIAAGEGDDFVVVSFGEDLIDGGAGNDTVAFEDTFNRYTLSRLGDGVLIRHLSGVETIADGIERLEFAHGEFVKLGTGPLPISVSTHATASNASQAQALKLEFTQQVAPSEGTIAVKSLSGLLLAAYPAKSSSVRFVGESVYVILPKNLNVYIDYIVEISPNFVQSAGKSLPNDAASLTFKTPSIDGLYHFFVVAFAAAPGSVYMGQLAEAYNYFQSIGSQNSLNNIVELFTTKTQFTSIYPQALVREDKGSYFSYAHDLSVESKPLVRGAEVTRDVYNQQMAELSKELVERIVKQSASTENKTQAVADIQDALALGGEWTIGKVIYTVFGNLANKPLDDPDWGNTALQFNNQTVVARYLTEVMQYPSEDVEVLRSSIAQVSHLSNVSNDDNVISLIGSLPPGG